MSGKDAFAGAATCTTPTTTPAGRWKHRMSQDEAGRTGQDEGVAHAKWKWQGQPAQGQLAKPRASTHCHIAISFHSPQTLESVRLAPYLHLHHTLLLLLAHAQRGQLP